MKKKLLLLVALITATIAFAKTEINGIYYNLNNSNQTAEVTSGSNRYSGDITIPEKVTYNATEYSVTSIGHRAFSNCSSLTSISIPNSVTSIGREAFYYNSSLTSIAIPNSITYIGVYAFTGCQSLSAVYVSDVVAWCNIDCGWDSGSNPLDHGNLYLNGEKVVDLIIPEGVDSIKDNIFRRQDFRSITIPNSVTYIGSEAFLGCSFLTNVDIPNSVIVIGNRAFSGCSGFTSIEIPNSVIEIGREVFNYCSSLRYAKIGNGVKKIGDEAFQGCSSLDTLICNFNDSLIFDTDMDYNPFRIPTLRYLTAPTVVFNTFREEIQTQFSNKLTEVHISDGDLDENGFNFINRSYKSLHTIDLAGATNTTINDLAFYDCYKLENLTLPKNIETIGYKAFAECVHIKQLEIPATVINIEERAFENCRSINTLTFEEGSALESIGSWAFYNNHALESVELPEGVKEIGDAAFYGCTYMEEIVIPASVQRIGDNGFALCNQVKRMEVRATTPPTIEAKTFHQVSRDIEFIVPTEARNAYAQDKYWREFIQKAPTNVENTIEGIEIYTQNGTLHIEGATENYHILDAAGRLIYSGNASILTLPRGIYLVTMGGEVEKIVL